MNPRAHMQEARRALMELLQAQVRNQIRQCGNPVQGWSKTLAASNHTPLQCLMICVSDGCACAMDSSTWIPVRLHRMCPPRGIGSQGVHDAVQTLCGGHMH